MEAIGRFYISVRKENGAVYLPLRFSRQEKRILRKRAQIPVSEWAEKHRVLPQDAPIPGPWKNRNVPYVAGVMDASFFPSVQEIVVCAAPQAAKTEGVLTCLGYAADRKPGNALIVFPDENAAKETNKDRIQPMFRDSRRLRSYATGYVDDESSLRINLQHMRIYMAWANSASRLASKPLPYVFLDEVDKFPETANKKEAGPIDLAKKRTRNFGHMRKIWITSSPTIETGPIWMALNEAEVVFDYVVRCPSCGATQKMAFQQIKWPDGSGADPNAVESEKLAWYECEKCTAHWTDTDRNEAVRSGEWRDRAHDRGLMTALKSLRPLRIGFHIPAWLSPFVSLSECAAAFLRGLVDKTKLKDFSNGFAAEPWRVYQKEREESKILGLKDDRPRGRVPGKGVVAALTAGVDTQDYGFWYEIRAWGWGGPTLSKDSWCVQEGYVESFLELEKVLWGNVYMDDEGNEYPVVLVLQDAMGHRTNEVYDFCRKHRGMIYPTKGFQDMTLNYRYANQEYYPGGKKPIPGGLKRIDINTKVYKDELSRLLDISPGDPGAWRYHSEFPEAYAFHMTAEFQNEKGLWECPARRQNHLWDCAVLNLCAHEMKGIKTWKRKEKDREMIIEKAKQPWIGNSDNWIRR
jgi:phage terminase large subunit GpA-like protein